MKAQRLLTLIVALTVSSTLFAQSEIGANPFLNDANGRPLYLKSTYDAEGNPFFADSYIVAELTSGEGKVYSNIKVKFNILENEIYYMNPDGNEMVAAVPIRKITFKEYLPGGDSSIRTLISQNGLLNVRGSTVYQLLSEGKKRLLKKITVSYKDTQGYGSANTIRSFSKSEVLMIEDAKQGLKKLERNCSDLLFELSDKKTVGNYISQNNLKCRSEADLTKIFNYYNSL